MCKSLLALLLLTYLQLSGQSSLSVSPAQISIQFVAGGIIPPQQPFTVSGPSNWSATAGDEWIFVNKTGNSGSVGIAGWFVFQKPAGTYPTKITISAPGANPVTVTINVTATPKVADPSFTYLAGPTGCKSGHDYPDAAVCAVPGEKPPGNFTPPAAGESYVDPNFGATVKILSGAHCLHQYSTPSAISAHNKYVLTSCGVIELATANVVFLTNPSDFQGGTFWDAFDDNVFYFYSGAKVIKRNLQSGVTTLVDYSNDGQHNFKSITMGGTGDTSKDNWVAFYSNDAQNVCALDLNKVKTYCANFATADQLHFQTIDFPMMSKGVDSATGKRYVILQGPPSTGVFSVNLTTGKLDLEYRGPENPEAGGNHNGICDPGESCLEDSHSDTFEDSKGIQYLVSNRQTETPCEFALNTWQLNKGLDLFKQVELGGGRRKVLTIVKCQGDSTDGPVVFGLEDYVACAKSAPYCAITTSYDRSNLRDPADKTPILRGPHLSEIFVMRDNGVEIRRLAENRSVLYRGDEVYWSVPRASISSDGSWVVADSNFGVPAPDTQAMKVIAIKTGFGKTKIADAGVVNAASGEPKLAPGAIATIRGESLADCAGPANTFPLPTSLCGSTLSFNGKPGYYLYASATQLNVVLPFSLPLQTDLQTIASRADSSSDPAKVPAANFNEEAPAIFTYSLADQVTRGAIQNSDFSVNGPVRPDIGLRPLQLGETGVIYANALGPTNPPVPDGQPSPSDTPAQTVRQVQVFVNDTPQTVLFSGLTPGQGGLYQVNFTLDPSTPINDGDNNFVRLNVNGFDSPRVVISIAPAPADASPTP